MLIHCQRLLQVAALVTVLSHWSEAVDRGNFKSCDQSSFCKRQRATQPGQSPYELQLNTLKIHNHYVDVGLINIKNNVQFILSARALQDSTFRLKINEVNPLKKRYEVEYALAGEPVPADEKIHVAERNADKVLLVSGKSKLVLYAKPFRVEVFSGSDLVIVVSERGLLKFEHLRKKPETAPPADGEAEAVHKNETVNEDEPGMWEEHFKSHRDSKPYGPSSVGLDVTFVNTQNVYGIPEHADAFSLRETKSGDPYRLYNFDVFEYELNNPMALYGSIPVMLAHSAEHTVGMFWLNAAETWIDVSIGPDENVLSSLANFMSGSSKTPQMDTHWMSESGIIDIFFMLGPSPKDVLRQYGKLTGTTPLPQMFAISYHQCRWNYNDQEDVREVDLNFDFHDIPYDAIWLDIEYTDGKKYFTWDKRKFPNPTDMVNRLSAKGRKMVVIIDPHIKRDNGYFVHDEATKVGYYVKNKDGNDFEGWCWPGSSSYLDFFNPEVRTYWAQNFAPEKFQGSTQDLYIWNDMNEPSVFNGPEVTMHKDCVHHGGWEHRDVHNLYGLVNVMSTFQGLLERSYGKLRPFILTRAHYAGSQRYTAVWTGDNVASWDHLRITIPMCLSLSITGMSFCGADVGGFFNNPDTHLITRWYQAGAFQPFFRAHAHIDTRRREPWLFDEETKSIIRSAIRKRYSLLPMWYTLFYENEQTGVPPMRPLWLEYPQDANTFPLDDEYMLGNILLVKPVTAVDAVDWPIYFPGQGEHWYDIDTFSKTDGGQLQRVPVTRDKIPVYQRGGTILPKKERVRRASALMHDDPYTLVVALDKNSKASGRLYIDDGQSYEYQNGKFLHLALEYSEAVLKSRYLNPQAHYATNSWLERVVIVGIHTSPSKIEITSHVSGKSVGHSTLEFNHVPSTGTLVIRKPGVNMGEEWEISLK